MSIEVFHVDITTDASGDSTDYTGWFSGRILQIRYVDTDLAAGAADFVMTLENTGAAVLTLTNQGGTDATWAPRQATHDVAGAASLYAAAGESVEDYIWGAADNVKIVTAQGGDTKSGTIYVTVEHTPR
ncbi:MAG: hypothetical protein ACYSUF_00395 [Planctomycetota bacterium]|jgi:hypothetical protein